MFHLSPGSSPRSPRRSPRRSPDHSPRRHVSRWKQPCYKQGHHFGIPKGPSNTDTSSSGAKDSTLEELLSQSQSQPQTRPSVKLVKENVPTISVTSAPATATLSGGTVGETGTHGRPSTPHTKPINIQLPVRRFADRPVYTPPEPLSARGDKPGGYFPDYEDPNIRVYRGHPFHKQAEKAKRKACRKDAEVAANSPPWQPFNNTSDPQYTSMQNAMSAARMRGTITTPAASYMPTGHDSPLPLGKYYPSNWEKRQQQAHQGANPNTNGSQNRPNQQRPMNTQSDSQVSQYQSGPSHQRSNSEAKRKLLQYQRDMVAQASLGIRHTYGGADHTARAKVPSPSYGQALRNIQQGSAPHRPISPRLAPMGSPGGPVTPMDLEDNEADGFFSKGREGKRPDETRRFT